MKKKVLHIVESFGSGVFTFLVDLVNGTDDDFDITIAYGVREETLENFKDYFSDKIKFVRVENFTRSISPKKDLKALKEIKKIIKEEKPDIVHLHSSKAGVLGRLAVNGSKIKMFYNPHGFSFLKQDDSKFKRSVYWLIEKITAMVNRKCTIVGCSNGEYEEAKKLNKNSICINNGIDIEKLDKETSGFKEKKIDFDNLKICTVGRIGYQKNPEMFNKIAESFPNLQFTWIGDGDLKDKLTSPNITITGWKTREETLKILNEHDVFVLCSLWEGLPISLLEAMYFKKICIVSDCIGNRDVIVDGENGFVANKLEEYLKIIQSLLERKIDINGIIKKAREDVVCKFNIKLMIDKYETKYVKKKVVLHIVNSNIFSGLEKVAIEIIKNLENEYDLYYVTKDGPIIKYLEQNEVKRIKITKVSIREIRRICKEYKPDILHVHDYTATIISAMSLIKVPIISHLHNNSPWIKTLHPYSFALLLASLRCKKILIVSDSIEKEYMFKRFIKKKFINIGNPVSVENIRKKVKSWNNKKYDICFSGRLNISKNPLKFIRIISKVKEYNPSVNVLMLGDGELKDECERLIVDLQLQKNIEMKGFVEEPYEFMSQAKIFCLTSNWEGYGLVTFEALALGLPCIVSPVGGLINIVDEECGDFCKTTEEWSEKIKQYMDDKDLLNRKSLNAIKKARKLDNYSVYFSMINKIYIRLGDKR